jgi:acyl-CoA synthetase (AMP-forming)/AMP-acid ligase II
MQMIEMFDRGVSLYPENTCFVLADGSQSWTFAETSAITHRIAAALTERGIGVGARIGVLSHNEPRAFMCILGGLRAGGCWLAMNARSSAQDLADLLELTGCDVLFYAGSMADHAMEIASKTTVGMLVAIGPGGRPEDPELDDFMAPEGTTVGLPPYEPERVAMYMGTGGTTGKPKAVQMPHRAFNAMTLGLAVHMHEDAPPVQLLAAPMTHAAGGITFVVFGLGGTHVVHDGVNPKEIFESIERHKVTRLFLPPTAIYALLSHPDVRDHDYSSLRHFLYAAAPMSVDKLKEAMEVFGPCMCQCFGQSEVPMICTWFGPDEHAQALADRPDRLATCGRATVVASVAIMDDDGNVLPNNERGEIVVRSDLRMLGYLNDPVQTAETDRGDGWHGTSDIGYRDDDGYFYIVDRKRDMIISGGFNVFPSEIEQVIWSHPAVEDCAVIGVPDEKWGESVTAVVELKAGEEVDGKELIALCRDRLGVVKTPKSVIFRDLPRSPVGKVLKRELRKEYWEDAGRSV